MEQRVAAGRPISRVKCVVDTCRYNEKGRYCLANSIEIQYPAAKNTQETDCATFAPLEQN